MRESLETSQPPAVSFSTSALPGGLVRPARPRRPALRRLPDRGHRYELGPELAAAVQEHGLLYEEDEHGAFLQALTEVFGDRVFFTVVQRIGKYDGYGTSDAPVRMAAHRRARTAVGSAPEGATGAAAGR